MELYPEMNEKIKDILRIGNNPIGLYAAEYIEKLEKEILDRENSSIQSHNDLHYWRDRARKAEKEKDLAIAALKQAADDNGGCYGCKWFDWETEKCKNPKGIELCDSQTNNMWEWKGLED